MATMRENRPDSDIYEDTVVMPVSGTRGPQTSEMNTIYEPLRIEEGKLRQVHTARTRRGKCGKGRWLTVTAVVIAILSIGLSSFFAGMYFSLWFSAYLFIYLYLWWTGIKQQIISHWADHFYYIICFHRWITDCFLQKSNDLLRS